MRCQGIELNFFVVQCSALSEPSSDCGLYFAVSKTKKVFVSTVKNTKHSTILQCCIWPLRFYWKTTCCRKKFACCLCTCIAVCTCAYMYYVRCRYFIAVLSRPKFDSEVQVASTCTSLYICSSIAIAIS